MLSLHSALSHPSKLSDSSYHSRKPSLPDISYIVDLYPEFFPYLAGPDLAQCTRVSQTWNHYLNHHVTNPWKNAFLTDFSLPHLKSLKEEHYKILYGRRMFLLKNIKNNQPTKAIQIEIEARYDPSYLCINNRLVIATEGQIFVYSATGHLEQTLTSFPSNRSSTFLRRQNAGLKGENRAEQPLITPITDLKVYPAEGDLFFSRSGRIICLWEASTGKCLFAITDFSQYCDKEPSFIDHKIIYSPDPLEQSNADDFKEVPHSLVEVWDVKQLKLLGTFNLLTPYDTYCLSDDILISENGTSIYGHSLASKKKLFRLEIAENEIFEQNNSLQLTMKIVNSQLLVYFPGRSNIEVHDIKEGKLIRLINCGRLEESQPFQCFENRYLICSKEKSTLEVWDLNSGERLKILVPPPNPPPVSLMTIHHNRLVVQYRGDSSSDIKVWNLNNFSLLISEEYTEWNSDNAAFLDDYILSIMVNEESLFSPCQRILFWDILTGKFLGSRELTVDDIRVDQDHHKGKLLTLNSTKLWYKDGGSLVENTKYQWSFEDFTLSKPKFKSKVQQISEIVSQPFIDLLGFCKGTLGLSA